MRPSLLTSCPRLRFGLVFSVWSASSKGAGRRGPPGSRGTIIGGCPFAASPVSASSSPQVRQCVLGECHGFPSCSEEGRGFVSWGGDSFHKRGHHFRKRATISPKRAPFHQRPSGHE